MEEQRILKMTRKQLYDEIWKMSVSAVAKKYNLNYAKLIETCKNEKIPYPQSGYWTRLNLGKDVSNEVTELPKTDKEEIEVLLNGVRTSTIKKIKENKNIILDEVINDDVDEKEIHVTSKKENTDISKSDISIYDGVLTFLPEEERKQVVDKAITLEIKESGRLHSTLVQYKKSIELYNKQLKEAQKASYYNPRIHNPDKKPEFISEVSEDGLKRVIAILDAIFKAIESLGGHIDSDMSIKIKNDYVTMKFAEGQDKVKHELTKQEAIQMVKYNDEIKYHHYASKPQIRQYDHPYNGKLRVVLGDHKYIRDNETEKLEDRLGDILMALYEKAEENRICREQREEEQRKREEEARLREAIRERKELEILKTKELVNKAEDYRIACEIRSYVTAVKDSNNDIDEEWVRWAEKKADWYDPTIAVDDEFLGLREHGKSKEEKELEKPRRTTYGSWY